MSDQVLRSLPAVTSAPADFVVPNAAEWALRVVTATFDGSGAGGAYLPAVQIVSPGGVVVATYADRNVSVAAGASAEVTFGPFLTTQPTSAGGSGLRFDTSPQAGTWFFAETDGPAGGPDGYGFEWFDNSGNGVHFKTSGSFSVGSDFPNEPGILKSGSGVQMTIPGNGESFRVVTSGDVFRVNRSAGTDQVGFFGVTPVVRQATPVTLADVIALLQAYGLST